MSAVLRPDASSPLRVASQRAGGAASPGEILDVTSHRHALRRALGAFATGVAVVTTASGGVLHGLTINSFASVSLDPALVLWSLNKTSQSRSAFEAAEGFAVNVLARGQDELARRFARSGAERFAGVETISGLGGAPLLPGCVATFECRRVGLHEGGDHLIFIGEVVAFRSDEGEPLVFSRGKFGGFSQDV